MPHPFPSRAAAIFVCRSGLPLHGVYHRVQQHYGLPDFTVDEHSTWEYAMAMGQVVGFNITKTEQPGTIRQWMADVPYEVNYQIVVYLADRVEQRATYGTNEREVTVHSIGAFLRDVFQTEVIGIGASQP